MSIFCLFLSKNDLKYIVSLICSIMINIYDINTNDKNKEFIKQLRDSFKKVFNKVKEGEVYIISNFPSTTDNLGGVDYLFFINIPYAKGNYYSYKEDGNRYYLNSLVIGIKRIDDENITDIDERYFYKNNKEEEFDYIKDLNNEAYKFNSFAYNNIKTYINCVFINWVKAKSCNKTLVNDYLVLNKGLSIEEIVKLTCRRTRKKGKKGSNSLSDNANLALIIRDLIESANYHSSAGVLTLKKINQITKENQITNRISQLQGEKLCLITGKAGSGKTLALTRVLHAIVKQNKHARLLTFNNLLVLDIKQCLRNLGLFRNTNASIQTLHKFFFNLSKKMKVQALFTHERVQELLQVCAIRTEIANDFLRQYQKKYNGYPDSIDGFYSEFGTKIDKTDKIEISKYLATFFSYSEENLEEFREEYLKKEEKYLKDYLGKEVFINDYNKVLETTYLMLTDPKSFYEKYDIRNRHDFLIQINKTDKAPDEEYNLEDLAKHIKSTTSSAKWSNSILVDEAQDCNFYEKLILLHLKGAENLIVASGGKDQLIRSSAERNWTTMLGNPIPFDEVKLGNRCFRQKGNLVEFINQFTNFYELTNPMQPIAQSKGLGRVILDTRILEDSLQNDTIKNLKKQGEIYGCSMYENLMFLLPSIGGYTSKKGIYTMKIDSNDNVSSNKISVNITLEVEDDDLNIWSGVNTNKSNLTLPGQNQTRFIYYESCRGLEAWSVLCIDIDMFYYQKKECGEAEKYALEKADLFYDTNTLKSRYSLLWCLMAFTRPIDTLYLKLRDPSSEFSRNLLTIASNCSGVEIL